MYITTIETYSSFKLLWDMKCIFKKSTTSRYDTVENAILITMIFANSNE